MSKYPSTVCLTAFEGKVVSDGSVPTGRCDRMLPDHRRRQCNKRATKFVMYPWGVAQECDVHAKEDTA